MVFGIMGSLHVLVLLLCLMSTALGKTTVDDGMHVKMKGTIGVIADNNSRNGKEEIVAVKMAMEDFYHYSNQSFGLQIRDSHADPLQAALAGLSYFPLLFHSFIFYSTS